MVWKTLFWISAVLLSINFAGISIGLSLFIAGRISESESVWYLMFTAADFVAQSITLLGIFGYAYKKAIFKPIFWKVASVIVVVVTITYNRNVFIWNELDVLQILTILWITVSLFVLLSYAFGKNWVAR